MGIFGGYDSDSRYQDIREHHGKQAADWDASQRYARDASDQMQRFRDELAQQRNAPSRRFSGGCSGDGSSATAFAIIVCTIGVCAIIQWLFASAAATWVQIGIASMVVFYLIIKHFKTALVFAAVGYVGWVLAHPPQRQVPVRSVVPAVQAAPKPAAKRHHDNPNPNPGDRLP